MSSEQKIAGEVVNDLSTVGKIESIINLIVFGIFGIIGLIGGIYLMCKKNNYIQVSATVQSQTCNPSCNTTVTYVVNGVTLTGNVVLNEVLNQGGMVDIFYDQNNTSNLSSTSKNTFISGLVLTLFSLVLIGASIANYYLTSKSKIYSAAEGAQTIVNLI